jgi:SAM-dependent methyltransferase
MGIDKSTLSFLAAARERGVSFTETVTIGRQALSFGPRDLTRVLAAHGLLNGSSARHDLLERLGQSEWHAEPLFHQLGATKVHSMDFSDWEGADILWDLNEPIPPELEARFTVLFDGGSLEHIFNAPVALTSYMRMVRPGGHLLLALPANNYCGHGMYQFSPEFFFSALSEQNGFTVERMTMWEEDVTPTRIFGREFTFVGKARHYDVADPRKVGERVGLLNRLPACVWVQAKRISERPITRVQQSDYETEWAAAEGTVVSRPGHLSGFLSPATRCILYQRLAWDLIPRLSPLVDPARRWRETRKRSFGNRRHYKRVD